MRALTLAATLAAALVAACDAAAPLDALADGGSVKVVGVVDGDTLKLDDGRSIDLAGVLAPAPGEPYAAEAKAALEKVAGGRSVALLYGGSGDGPFHVRERRTRRWLQGELLAAGAARVRTGGQDRALAAEMLRLEARARAGRRGLWALAAYEVRLPDELIARRQSGFVLAEGRVVRVADQAGRTYLEFSRDWRGGFSAEIARDVRPAFQAAGVDLDGLQGRLIRVRGELRRTGYGPRLRLDGPEQLERLAEPAAK